VPSGPDESGALGTKVKSLADFQKSPTSSAFRFFDAAAQHGPEKLFKAQMPQLSIIIYLRHAT
jgi:hypothetical protein